MGNPNKTVGSQLLVLFKLALPIIIGNVAYATLNITDILMAGMAGTPDQAGVSIGGSFFFPSITFIVGMVSALHPIISRHCGADTKSEIPRAHAHAVVTCLIVSFILMTALILISLFAIEMDTDKRMEEVAKTYVIVVAFTIPVAALYTTSRAFCEAMGNTKATLYFGILSVILNVPLNYVLIFGLYGLPKLGGVGCGVATLISMSISTLVIFAYIRFHPKLKDYSWFRNKQGVSWRGIFEYSKLALPLGISTAVETSCFTMIALLLSPLGPIAVSAHTITMSLTSFIFNIPLSIGIAASIMVGYAIGQNNIDTLRYNIKAAYAAMIFSIAVSIALLLTARVSIVDIFSSDPHVIMLCTFLLFFAAANQSFESVQTIQAFLLRGFKDTNTILVVTFISFYIVALPLGVSLCYGFINVPASLGFSLEGPVGFWIGLGAGLVTASILYRFRVLKHYRALKGHIDGKAVLAN